MDTLGKRVKQVIIYNGETMTSFAKSLNISQSMVSKICSDTAIPSERTISDICRIYDINPEWLLSGSGKMVNRQSFSDRVEKKLSANTSEITRQFLLLLADIPPAVWPVIAEFLENIAEECKNNPGPGTRTDGARTGAKLFEAVKRGIAELPKEPEP